MATHFQQGPDDGVACGRNNHNLTATPQTDRVTCKSCLSSARYAAAIAAAETSTPAPIVSTYNWRRSWAEKARMLRPADRLPRGMGHLEL